MKAIVAADSHWGIGKDGQLLTHLPEDMKFFRTTTKGKVVIMGRKTLESFPGGNPLKNRINIVLTRDSGFTRDGAVICHTADEVLETVKSYDAADVYVIGGQSVYEQFLPYCDTAYVTHMDRDFGADTTFPDLDKAPDWILSHQGADQEHEGLHFSFCTYKKA